MKFIRKLENLIEKHLEGFFNKKFSGVLQPVEIAKRLVREMEAEKSVGVSQVYVPNAYNICLNKQDYERLCSFQQAFCDELAAYVAEQADQKGYILTGKPKISINPDEGLAAGEFRVAGIFERQKPEQPEAQIKSEDYLSDTRVFNGLLLSDLKHPQIEGILTVVKGVNAGMVHQFETNRVNIGRREGNEFPLSDMNTSRLHCYIVFEDSGHVLYDAKSLNGTYVNGHRVMRKRLQTGDRIKVGNTIILYEVK